MANTDKDILITPNNGSSSADPKIEFKGADASTSAQTITATAYPTNNGTLSFDGSAGQLFSITNDMTGTIFSVNDVSGIPSIEVDDDGAIRLAEYNGNVSIGTTTVDGQLHISGGSYTGNVDGPDELVISSTSTTGGGIRLTNHENKNWWVYHGGTSSWVGGGSLGFVYTDGTNAATGPVVTFNPSGTALEVLPDTDSSAEIGRAHVGYIGYGDLAGFSHVDQNSGTGYAFLQNASGDTYVNAPSGRAVSLRINNTNVLAYGGTYVDVSQPMYNYAVYYEDYDVLTGTSVTVNCNTAQAFYLSMTGNTTFTFNSVTNAWATSFVLEITGNGGTITWPSSVDWAGGTAPAAPASGETDIYVFYTRDGGTTWRGALAIDAAA